MGDITHKLCKNGLMRVTPIHCLNCVLLVTVALNPILPNKVLDVLCDWLIPVLANGTYFLLFMVMF